MKRFAFSFIALLLIAPVAQAAPKSIALALGSIYPAPAGTEMALISGKNLVLISNINTATSDIQITAQDVTRAGIWQRTIDSTADEVATSSTVDSLGNIWIAGASAPLAKTETPTSTIGIENPDAVSTDSPQIIRSDLNQITVWKLSPAGELLATYTSPQVAPALTTSISVANSGISLVGAIDKKPFFLSLSTTGSFGKLAILGSAKTDFNAVIRSVDGTSSVFGSSSETLAGKKIAGIRDGILLKISKAGTISSVVRSSAVKATRSWISADSTNLLSGPVVTGKVTETAITKFTNTFSPSWTLRVPSTGSSLAISAGSNSYLALTSKSALSGIPQWKPATPSLLVLTLDNKGAIKAATALPGLVTPISLQYSQGRGAIGLASSSDGTVSIFTLVSR